MITESLLLRTGLILFLSTAVGWLVFPRYSMARIEARLRAEGKNPAPWDGVSLRVQMYAHAIPLRGEVNGFTVLLSTQPEPDAMQRQLIAHGPPYSSAR